MLFPDISTNADFQPTPKVKLVTFLIYSTILMHVHFTLAEFSLPKHNKLVQKKIKNQR